MDAPARRYCPRDLRPEIQDFARISSIACCFFASSPLFPRHSVQKPAQLFRRSSRAIRACARVCSTTMGCRRLRGQLDVCITGSAVRSGAVAGQRGRTLLGKQTESASAARNAAEKSRTREGTAVAAPTGEKSVASAGTQEAETGNAPVPAPHHTTRCNEANVMIFRRTHEADLICRILSSAHPGLWRVVHVSGRHSFGVRTRT